MGVEYSGDCLNSSPAVYFRKGLVSRFKETRYISCLCMSLHYIACYVLFASKTWRCEDYGVQVKSEEVKKHFHAVYVSFTLKAGGRSHTESPNGLIEVITFDRPGLCSSSVFIPFPH